MSSNSQVNNASEVAMAVAPYSCSVGKETDIDDISDIAIAMSVLLFPVINLINGLCTVLSIIIPGIQLICKRRFKEKAVGSLA